MDLQEYKISRSIDRKLINFVTSKRCAKSDIDIFFVCIQSICSLTDELPKGNNLNIFNAEEGHRAPPVCNQFVTKKACDL